MKNIILILSLLSFHSFAVENGTPIDWDTQDNIVRFDKNEKLGRCTGMILAGHYVITAAHCLYDDDSIDTITTKNGSFNKSETSYILHPNYDDGVDSSSGQDVAIINIKDAIDYEYINFIFDLNLDPFNYGETIEINAFGGTEGVLNQATLKMTDWRDCDKCRPRGEYSLNAEMFNESHTTGGDSGASWINTKGEIVSIHKGSSLVSNYGETWRETYSTNLHYAKDFILENIDAWHYPTNVVSDGRTIITVQSLHKDNIVDSAYTSGDLIIIPEDSTCLNNSIAPFEKCTYVVEGDSGELFISNNESIKVEKPSSGGGESSGGDSGGSLGIVSLLLASFALRKRKH